MKITKEELNKMIQEELDAYLSETDVEDVTLEADDEMEDMPMGDMGAAEPNEELMASLRNLYDVLQGMFGAEEEAEEAEEEVDETVEVAEEEVAEAKDEEEVEESLNESVNRFKKLANIRG
jgi:ABC-type enterochelin transport system substrate-binding protein